MLTLTTGPKGTAAAKLPVASRKSEFWVKQVKAPEGYDLYKPAKIFTAGLGAPVTVTVTNAKTAVAPKPTPSRRPTHQPTNRPLTPTGMPTEITSGHPKPDALTAGTRSALSPTAAGSGFVSADAPTGALAQTGAGVTPWVLGGAGLLLAGGIGVVVAARRRALSVSGKEATGETN
ncbi:LPXTG cell wall anchor domain-containing protein [Streptomyces sp. NBC_01255]|uniref:LPXTG cell wall anchor domain-containing protein n=1 Tax=Streptomyces sp. NBC_01255 TaxID=2903798 RepID=UPI002E309CAC|nr:LPXTG cell wall anchor domain-containing protein [Streptomyces sp. NBC_01255]